MSRTLLLLLILGLVATMTHATVAPATGADDASPGDDAGIVALRDAACILFCSKGFFQCR